MSITRDKGLIVFQCDNCHDTLETETNSFQGARDLLKATKGWFARKLGKDWYHFCDDSCHQEFMTKRSKERLHGPKL